MGRPQIELEGVTKRYGSIVALADLCLNIEGGELCCLLGRNGAGKTSVINAIMGLTYPTRGEVRIGGVDTRSTEIHEVRRSVGYLPQRSVLYEQLTGREFIRFIGGLYEITAAGFRAADRHLEALGLGDAADRRVREYSVGMKRRLAFMASILHEPAYLILDEPTGSLDVASVVFVEEVMTRYRNEGRLVLFSTHQLDLAERCSDRLVVLDGGRLTFTGCVPGFRAEHGLGATETLEDLFLRTAAPARDFDIRRG